MSTSESLGKLGRLSVIAPGARIRVLNAYLQQVVGATAMDTLTATLVPGAYRVTARIGAREVSQAVLVRAGGPPSEVRLEPAFDAAAPVDKTATINESHGELAWELTSGAPPAPGRLVVMLRGLRHRTMAEMPASAIGPTPTVRDQDGRVMSMPVPAEDPHHVRNPRAENRALGWAVDVAPGGCRIRWSVADGSPEVEHALWIAPESQTVLFVPQGPAGPVAAGASVHILPIGTPWDAYAAGTIAVEATLAVLRSGSTRQRLEVWQGILHDHGLAPMLSLLTLHEMVRSTGADVPRGLRRDTEQTLDRLRTVLGESPDVVALVATLNPSSLSDPVAWPPMLRTSHDLLLAAARSGRDVIAAGSLAERVTGQMYGSAPWHIYDPTGLDVAAPVAPAAVPPAALPAVRPPSGPFHSGEALEEYAVRPVDRGTWGPDTWERETGERETGERETGERDAGGRDTGERDTGERDTGERDAGGRRDYAEAPPPVAVERVRELLEMVGSAPGGGRVLEPDEVAERLGMTPRLAESCLEAMRARRD
jgi:hypothetical protein